MQVIYKRSVFEKMDMAFAEANGIRKTIEKFILNRKEWEEFLDIYRPICVCISEYEEYLFNNKISLYYKCVLVECEV